MNTLEQVLSEVLSVSIWSLSIGLIVGGVTGLLIGVIKKSIKLALFPSIFGSFLGTLLIAFVPLFSIPGLVNGGGYAGIYVLAMLIFLIPFGSIAGGILGATQGLNTPKSSQKRIFGILILIAYLILIIGILMRVVVFGAG